MKFAVLVLNCALLFGCADKSCLDQEAVRVRMADAAKLELSGQLQAAYARYKEVNNFSCEISTVELEAESEIIRIGSIILTAHDDTRKILDSYFAENGRYPDSLEQIKERIPERSRIAFSGFTYARNSDTDVGIVTGLYGSKSFSLNGR